MITRDNIYGGVSDMESIVELRHLRTLLALEETGSVSMAAKRVFFTQSAL